MKISPNAFIVTDIETTDRQKLAFDVAWKVIDRHGNDLGQGSYIIPEAFNVDIPYYREKFQLYFEFARDGKVQIASMIDVMEDFNGTIIDLENLGYTPIFCAYNTAYDAQFLSESALFFTGKKFLEKPIKLLDIWHAWCISCPKTYNGVITTAGNYKTSAEAVYAFESGDPHFSELHVAFDDVKIEAEILLKVLKRRKKLPYVTNPKDLNTQPWRLANKRIKSGFAHKFREKVNNLLTDQIADQLELV